MVNPHRNVTALVEHFLSIMNSYMKTKNLFNVKVKSYNCWVRKTC